MISPSFAPGSTTDWSMTTLTLSMTGPTLPILNFDGQFMVMPGVVSVMP